MTSSLTSVKQEEVLLQKRHFQRRSLYHQIQVFQTSNSRDRGTTRAEGTADRQTRRTKIKNARVRCVRSSRDNHKRKPVDK